MNCIVKDLSLPRTSMSVSGFAEESDQDTQQTLAQFKQNCLIPPLSEGSSDSDAVEFPLYPSAIDSDAEPVVAVIGVGYVGEHLVESFSPHYKIIAFDVSPERIADLKKKYGAGSGVRATTRATTLREVTHFLISVPTLLRPDKTIDSSYLRQAVDTVAAYGRSGSTRVDPGRAYPRMQSIPKVISGLEDVVPGSTAAITRLYSPVFETLIPVSQPEVAEMMKLYENCQRMVCIAFANEMADACGQHRTDPSEVARAAATKPFGYMPFTPSLGLGGHCIPINPYYLLSNIDFPLLKVATEKMWVRPAEIAHRALAAVAGLTTAVGGCAAQRRLPRILVVGVGFKRGQAVMSNSPGLELVKTLAMSRKVEVLFADALVKQSAIPQVTRLDDSAWNKTTLEMFDMIIVSFKQVGTDFSILESLQSAKVEMRCN